MTFSSADKSHHPRQARTRQYYSLQLNTIATRGIAASYSPPFKPLLPRLPRFPRFPLGNLLPSPLLSRSRHRSRRPESNAVDAFTVVVTTRIDPVARDFVFLPRQRRLVGSQVAFCR